MLKKLFHWLFSGLILLNFNISHAETYYLKRIESPEKDGRSSMIVSDPRDAGYMTTMTIKDNRIFMNTSDGDDGCDIHIFATRPFGLNRGQLAFIDDWGGERKFERFLNRKLNTSMKEWETRISAKVKSNPDNGPCALINRTAMIKSGKKIILWGGVNFYLFELGKDWNENYGVK